MVSLKEKVKVYVTAKNYYDYKDDKLVVQSSNLESGQFGERIVLKVKDVTKDMIVYVPLSQTALKHLIGQNINDTEELIGKQIRLEKTEVRGKETLIVKVVE